MPPELTADEAARASAVLDWFESHRRDLPWRRTRDPWAVLVAELMLQQTQVERVSPKYEQFLERLPTVAACAAAPASVVVGLWAGLGYNRRAINLHRCATIVVAQHGGVLPCDLDGLLALPGIGPYTARAVLAFAHEADVGVLDTNAARVLARWSGRALSRREAQAAADRAVPQGDGWRWNQAMLDLGATHCRARVVDCGACPARRWCAWGGADRVGTDPAIGSAAVSTRQSPFPGSDRQGRGRLVDALRAGEVAPADVPAVMGWPAEPARAARVAATLVADGLATVDAEGRWRLPD